ncbi:MAG TPA: SH3 domain-containing protein [Anaerolineales bacterium]|nr:SH3 domain-containing protein [Anaerolineales bacterium]
MAFNLVYLSQDDPQWKNDTLGFGEAGDTIGFVGCALTSIAMLLSGYGYPETPQTLNQKLKDKKGFVSAGIRWDVVSQVHPQVKLRENIRCETTDAPLGKIDAALNAGQPVVVRVDASPNPGLQWHYVLLYARKGDDYLMLDPWPYQPGTAKEDFLMKRYSQGRLLRQAIQHVLLYEAAGSGAPIPTPSTENTTPTPTDGGVYARVMDSVTWGLNIRSSTNTSSLENVVASVRAGTQLRLLNPNEAGKIGSAGQWVRVREPSGREGFAAAWYLEKIGGTAPAPVPQPAPAPANETPATPTAPAPLPPTPPINTDTPSTPMAPPDSGKLTLVVSEAVGTSGLRLRKSPSMSGALLMVVRAGTRLVVMEPEGKARRKIGKANQWIYVREPGGKRGYVGAEYVKLA